MVGLGIGLSLPLPFLQNNFAMDAVRFRSVLVLGGSSALGASAIQLLHLALPQCQILVTASPKHHMHITEVLGAQMVFDRNSPSLIVDIRDATSNSNGVDAILDTVGAGASERHIFDTFRPDGPRRYAQVWTGDNEIEVPVGVESVLFRSRDFQQMPGGENMFLALETLLREEKYKAPLATRMIGSGLEYLEAGLDEMRKGVSGEKLIVLA
jgi:NADPH:quinone reductase-like Zn-dependent oxidoreductase